MAKGETVATTLETILLQGYEDNGRTLEWGKNLTTDQKEAMRAHEIFTLLDKEGKPHSKVLMDFYGAIREKPIA